jgi:hypothetical protein
MSSSRVLSKHDGLVRPARDAPVHSASLLGLANSRWFSHPVRRHGQ